MNNLKDMAARAKNRLLNRGLRETYTNANVLTYSNMNFFNNPNNRNKNRDNDSESPFKYLLNEDKMMHMSPEDKERFLLDTIRKYQEERRKFEKDII